MKIKIAAKKEKKSGDERWKANKKDNS